MLEYETAAREVNRLQAQFPKPSEASRFFAGFEKLWASGPYDPLDKKQFLFTVNYNSVDYHFLLGLDQQLNALQLHSIKDTYNTELRFDVNGYTKFAEKESATHWTFFDLFSTFKPISFGRQLGSGKGIELFKTSYGPAIRVIANSNFDFSTSIRARKDQQLGFVKNSEVRELNRNIEYPLQFKLNLLELDQRVVVDPQVVQIPRPSSGDRRTVVTRPEVEAPKIVTRVEHFLRNANVEYSMKLKFQNGFWGLFDQNGNQVDTMWLTSANMPRTDETAAPTTYLSSARLGFEDNLNSLREAAKKRPIIPAIATDVRR